MFTVWPDGTWRFEQKAREQQQEDRHQRRQF
jgi:hypothetical protein